MMQDAVGDWELLSSPVYQKMITTSN